MTDVKMKHPNAKGSINVREDQVEMYESQGWVAADASRSASDKPSEK